MMTHGELSVYLYIFTRKYKIRSEHYLAFRIDGLWCRWTDLRHIFCVWNLSFSAYFLFHYLPNPLWKNLIGPNRLHALPWCICVGGEHLGLNGNFEIFHFGFVLTFLISANESTVMINWIWLPPSPQKSWSKVWAAKILSHANGGTRLHERTHGREDHNQLELNSYIFHFGFVLTFLL